MSLRDTFARGFVWKLAGLLALAAFGWLAGMGEAKAQSYANCNLMGAAANGALCPDMATAYSAAKAAAQQYVTQNSLVQPPLSVGSGSRVVVDGMNRTFVYVDVMRSGAVQSSWFRQAQTACPSGQTWDTAANTCKAPCDPNGAPLSGGYMKYTGSEPGYQTCSDGCEYNPSSMTFQTGTIDGITFVSLSGWIPSGASCTVGPNDGFIPPADADGDGISDGNDTAPANPGQGAGGGDEPSGEDGEPGEGSGNGNESTGGGDCATPPNSHGDQIAAQIAYQTWATRCAIEGAKDADGNLKTNATGDGTGNGSGDGTGGLGTCTESQVGTMLCTMKETIAGIKEWLDGLGTEASGMDMSEGETEEPESIWLESPEEVDLDSSGFGWGSSCPNPPTYMGESLDPTGNLCMFASLIGAFMLLGAYAQAAYIIGRA